MINSATGFTKSAALNRPLTTELEKLLGVYRDERVEEFMCVLWFAFFSLFTSAAFIAFLHLGKAQFSPPSFLASFDKQEVPCSVL